MFKNIRRWYIFIKEKLVKKEPVPFSGGVLYGGVFSILKIPSGAFNNEAVVKYITAAIIAVITGLFTAMGAHLGKLLVKHLLNRLFAFF